MRKAAVRLLFFLNIFLGLAIIARAGGAQILPNFLLKNCCQIDGGGEEYCAENKCVRLWDECHYDWECEPSK